MCLATGGFDAEGWDDRMLVMINRPRGDMDINPEGTCSSGLLVLFLSSSPIVMHAAY